MFGPRAVAIEPLVGYVLVEIGCPVDSNGKNAVIAIVSGMTRDKPTDPQVEMGGRITAVVRVEITGLVLQQLPSRAQYDLPGPVKPQTRRVDKIGGYFAAKGTHGAADGLFAGCSTGRRPGNSKSIFRQLGSQSMAYQYTYENNKSFHNDHEME